MRTAIVIEPDGRIHDLERAAEKPTLEELHKAVGGWIEVVRLATKHTLMVVDDEGRIKGKPMNPLASLLYGFERHGEPIVGPAVLIDAKLLD